MLHTSDQEWSQGACDIAVHTITENNERCDWSIPIDYYTSNPPGK